MTLSHLKEWHKKSGIPYPFPDMSGPGWLPPLLSPHGGLGLKMQLEVFLWLDLEAPRSIRSRTLLELETKGVETARAQGLDEVVAWLPPMVEPRFGPILAKRGWHKSPWPSWSRQLR